LATQAQTVPPLATAGSLGQDLFLKSGATGMVLVVVRDHQTSFHGYGETAPGSGQTPTRTSILRLCSLTKIFTTDLLVKLTADGLVTLDDPLQHYAPRAVKVPARPDHPITLEELATHTAGLAREVGTAPHGTPHFNFPGYTYRWHWLATQRLKSTPGTEALYSNVGFDLLGDALAGAAGKSYAQLLYERTTLPLGLRETGYTPTLAQCNRLLQGAHDEGPCTDTQNTAGSSGLYSTAADMALWLDYLLDRQNPAAQEAYLNPANLLKQTGLDHAGKPTALGLGWMHIAATDGSDITEKTGGGAGFLTYIALSQAHHTAIFFAMTDGAVETHLNAFHEANYLLLALEGLPPLPPEPPRPAAPKKPRKRLRR
jgi:D-alanyl-D-alanine-carboxypeptidase/D-alanyl-D-alanine-endopeptidase